MKYIIYVMVQPSHLKEVGTDGYYLKTTYRDVLERLDVNGVNEEHPTMESAIEEIRNKQDKLSNLDLTILPVIKISWDGKIKE